MSIDPGNRWRVRRTSDPTRIPWQIERYTWGRWHPVCEHMTHRNAIGCADDAARHHQRAQHVADRRRRDYGLASA